jgi:hypothetical protein
MSPVRMQLPVAGHLVNGCSITTADVAFRIGYSQIGYELLIAGCLMNGSFMRIEILSWAWSVQAPPSRLQVSPLNNCPVVQT